MNSPISHSFDPTRDLSFERLVDVTPEQIWAAWTQPELIKKWFTPAPWTTIDCEIDLRPRGPLQHCHAITGRSGIPKYRLLSGNHSK